MVGPVGHGGLHWHDTPGRDAGPEVEPATASMSGQELAEECEAFLRGNFADLRGSRHQPVEAWAWVNCVAHAEPEELKALANRALPWRRHRLRAGGFRSRRWRRAVSYIARDLLSLAGEKPRAIRRLQARALVPLELDLAGRGSRYPVTPEVLLARARAALYKGRLRASGPLLPNGEGLFYGEEANAWPRRNWARAGNIAMAALSVVVVGTLVVLAGANSAGERGSSPLYRYYLSRLSSLSDRSLRSPQAFAWITGGGDAPGWEGGRDLPTFLLPWQADGAGSYVGGLFAGAPGPVMKGAEALNAGTEVPTGASVDVAASIVSFSSRSVSFEAAALADHRFRVAGFLDPTVVVPDGSVVHVDLVNEDATTAHGLAVVPRGAASSSMPMATTKPAFPGSALWFLGDATADGSHEGVITFKAARPGVYQYVDPVPGSAKAGMVGTLEVARVSDQNYGPFLH